MSSFPVNPSTESELVARMKALGIQECDLKEQFIRGSGAGGQKINKTSSCVQLTHIPTGISVRCQRERSQAMNRFYARRELCERMEARITGKREEAQREISKIRRQKAKRSKRNKQKLVDAKRHTSTIKQGRKSWRGE